VVGKNGDFLSFRGNISETVENMSKLLLNKNRFGINTAVVPAPIKNFFYFN